MDPYLLEHYSDYKYFEDILNTIQNIRLSKNQESYLLSFVFHPHYSAYDIEPNKKIQDEKGDITSNDNAYRRAKNIVNKLCELKLIERDKEKEENPLKKKNYSLTDNGLFYILRSTSLRFYIQSMIRNYPYFKMFKDLLYPFIKLGTLCSEDIPVNILNAISLYLQQYYSDIENFLNYSKNEVNWHEYTWNWDEEKLREYLIDKYLYKYKWLENSRTEEYFDPPSLKFFNKNKRRQYIYIKLRFKGDRISGHLIEKRTKKKEIRIPKIETFLIKFHRLSKEESIGRSFSNLYTIRPSKFVFLSLSTFTSYTKNTSLLFSKDENFIKSLEAAKEDFDNFYLAIKNPYRNSFEALFIKDLQDLAYQKRKSEDKC